MRPCPRCHQQLDDHSRFCTRCGTLVMGSPETPSPLPAPGAEDMSLPVLVGMAVLLVVVVLFPPWETAPDQPPEFLGFRFILSPAVSRVGIAGVISRLLWTIELVTVAMGGIYFAWLFRRKT